MKKETYLVPYDFKSSTESALNFALNLARKTSGKIVLLHVVKDQAAIPAAEAKLDKVLSGLNSYINVTTSRTVVKGDLYKKINEVAKKEHAQLIALGTNGIKGLQGIFGANALKVVNSTEVPLVINQSGYKFLGISRILVPFSFDKDSVNITTFCAKMAELFNAEIFLAGFKHDDSDLVKDMKANAAVIAKNLKRSNVKFELLSLPGGAEYEKALLEYAGKNRIDLIASAHFSQGLKSFYNSFSGKLIFNEYQIPVLTINAEKIASKNASFFF